MHVRRLKPASQRQREHNNRQRSIDSLYRDTLFMLRQKLPIVCYEKMPRQPLHVVSTGTKHKSASSLRRRAYNGRWRENSNLRVHQCHDADLFQRCRSWSEAFLKLYVRGKQRVVEWFAG